MNSHAQRRRQQNVLRPRQCKNDVNTGALGPRPAAQAEPEPKALNAVTPSMRRCAERDLI